MPSSNTPGALIAALIFVILATTFAGCQSAPDPHATPPHPGLIPGPLEEDVEVCEATLRELFDTRFASGDWRPRAYFIEVELGLRPSAEFLARFANHLPPVKCGSEFRVGEGILLKITQVEHVDHATAVVHAEYYIGPRAAGGLIYIVELRDGMWHVTKQKQQWIS